ncbi:MAG: hypothetical protein WC680_11110 [Sulfuricurvum sp.]|jgi:hypothetical protein
MTPSIHTTITYGIDSALIFPLMFLGIMVIFAIMSYNESRGDSGLDAKQIKELIDEHLNERKKDQEQADFKGDPAVFYTRNELISTDDFAKNIDVLIDRLNDHDVEKIGILQNDMLSAVVVSQTQYQRLLKYSELYSKEEKHHDDA